jgi:hypothetical protein
LLSHEQILQNVFDRLRDRLRTDSIVSNHFGIEINSCSSGPLAANQTSTHEYKVTTGRKLELLQIEATGTGPLKIEVQVETALNTFSTRFVKYNSLENPNLSIHLAAPITVPSGMRVRIIRTNRERYAQEVSTTICGQEV